MSAPVNPTLLRFALEIEKFIDELYEKYAAENRDFYEIYEPAIRLYTVDGLTAVFYEEGIEFYPEEKDG